MKIKDKTKASFSNPVIAAYYCQMFCELFSFNLYYELRPKLRMETASYLLNAEGVYEDLLQFRTQASNDNKIIWEEGGIRNQLLTELIRGLCNVVLGDSMQVPTIQWSRFGNANKLVIYDHKSKIININRIFLGDDAIFSFCSYCAAIYQGLRMWEIFCRNELNVLHPYPPDNSCSFGLQDESLFLNRPFLYIWELDPRCGDFSNIFADLSTIELYNMSRTIELDDMSRRTTENLFLADTCNVALMIIDMLNMFDYMQRLPYSIWSEYIQIYQRCRHSDLFGYEINDSSSKEWEFC